MNIDDTLQGFIGEDVPENVYEADKFPPRFEPGQKVRFLFHLAAENPITLTTDNKVLRLAFEAEALALISKDGEQAIRATSSGDQPRLRFQQVDSRQGKTNEGNIIPSSLHRLFRALVGKDKAKLVGTDPRLVVEAMRELDGRETFEATVGWKIYNKGTQTEYSTSTRKARSYEKQDGTLAHYEPWPLVDGLPARAIDGEYGRDTLVSYIEKKLVKVEAGVGR